MSRWLTIIAEIIVNLAEAAEEMEYEGEKVKQIQEVKK